MENFHINQGHFLRKFYRFDRSILKELSIVKMRVSDSSPIARYCF